MQTTLKEINDAYITLDRLIDQQLPAAFGLKFARMHKELKPYREQVMEIIRERIHPLLQTDENGQPVRDATGKVLFAEGVTLADMGAAQAEVDAIVIDVDIEPLETRPIPGLKITPRQIEELDPFIVFI